jgi:hypothetical protein
MLREQGIKYHVTAFHAGPGDPASCAGRDLQGEVLVPASQDMENFAPLIEALHPWLDQVVVIGGWAHRLYRLHPLAQRLD